MKPTETIFTLNWRQGNAIVSTKKDRKFYCQDNKRAEKNMSEIVNALLFKDMELIKFMGIEPLR